MAFGCVPFWLSYFASYAYTFVKSSLNSSGEKTLATGVCLTRAPRLRAVERKKTQAAGVCGVPN